jgi:HEAT repeat protein
MTEFSDDRTALAKRISEMQRARDTTGLMREITGDSSERGLSARLAAQALGRLRAPEAIEPLAAWLNDRDEDVRYLAILNLGRIGDQAAAPHLLRALESERAPELQAWIVDSLGRTRSAEATNAILTLLDARDARVRYAAAEALGRIGDPRAKEPLRVARRREPIWRRWRFTKALRLVDRRGGAERSSS